jgi:four helix bundle protein
MDGIWKFEDLVAWKLAVQLQELADAYCRKPPIAQDFKFREQLADAAASGPRNLAEGFGRFYHPDFAKFARIAKASEEEVLKHFLDAKRKGYITLVECDDAAHAARKALKAVNGLIRYLDATPHFGRRQSTRSQRKI